MSKPPFLYHGSSKKLIGDKLTPKKAKDLDETRKDNLHIGVYATDIKEEAIVMAIVSGSDVESSTCCVDLLKKHKKAQGIIYEGWPTQDVFYVYTLSPETFENLPKGSSQFVSFEPVKPLKIETLNVKDYIHLVRKATKEEKDEWMKKYGDKIK